MWLLFNEKVNRNTMCLDILEADIWGSGSLKMHSFRCPEAVHLLKLRCDQTADKFALSASSFKSIEL